MSLDAGFTCPNVDGTVTTGGCVFCDNRSFSPSRRDRLKGINKQLDHGITAVRRRYGGKAEKFLAYFQPATNTYADVSRLRDVYYSALEHPLVVGMAIGTRPDCVGNDVLDLLQEIAAKTYLAVEYGIQTIHDRSLRWMNRGHLYDVFPDAMNRSRGRGFEICAHVILGLPGESEQDILETAREMARQRVDSIKIHNLYAVRGTPLAEDVLAGRVRLLERDEYIDLTIKFLELLPGSMMVERIQGDAPPDYLVGPLWTLKKSEVKLALEQEMARRDTWQGRLYQPA